MTDRQRYPSFRQVALSACRSHCRVDADFVRRFSKERHMLLANESNEEVLCTGSNHRYSTCFFTILLHTKQTHTIEILTLHHLQKYTACRFFRANWQLFMV